MICHTHFSCSWAQKVTALCWFLPSGAQSHLQKHTNCYNPIICKTTSEINCVISYMNRWTGKDFNCEIWPEEERKLGPTAYPILKMKWQESAKHFFLSAPEYRADNHKFVEDNERPHLWHPHPTKEEDSHHNKFMPESVEKNSKNSTVEIKHHTNNTLCPIQHLALGKKNI